MEKVDGKTDIKKQTAEPAKAKVEVTRLDVTLVKKGQNAWQVLNADGKDLTCDCGRPVEASLHNVSVPNTKLGPCERVKITK